MFENMLKRATVVVKETIQDEVVKGTRAHINLGVKAMGLLFLIGGAILAGKHQTGQNEPKKQEELVPRQTIYNFYNVDGEKIFELCKF